MNITVHGVQFAGDKRGWAADASVGSAIGSATIREGEDNGSEVTLFFWYADNCQQLADELTELANTMRQIENGTAVEDSNHG